MKSWDKAQQSWAQGLPITKCIGYDSSPRDSQRYAHAEGYSSDLYEYRYPLREWKWNREDCNNRIIKELGYTIPKSSCFFCTASKEYEIEALTKMELRLIVLLEARAAPRLKTVEGLWRKTRKGTRSTPRPGRMTDFIRDRKLLDADEIDCIWKEAPTALITWQEAYADTPISERPALQSWVDFFTAYGPMFEGTGVRKLYGDEGYQRLLDNLARVREAA